MTVRAITFDLSMTLGTRNTDLARCHPSLRGTGGIRSDRAVRANSVICALPVMPAKESKNEGMLDKLLRKERQNADIEYHNGPPQFPLRPIGVVEAYEMTIRKPDA